VRKVPLVLAAVPLVLAPLSPALAQTKRSVAEGGSRCPVPAVGTEYDVHQLVVHVLLPVSGCAARQHRVIQMDTTVRRVDKDGRGDGLAGGVTCGPYLSAGDTDAADPAEEESCGEGMGLDHPPVEAARYDIDITYPAASGKRTVTDVIFCRSDGQNVSCDPLAMGTERDTGS
jgi:hypothetical protein